MLHNSSSSLAKESIWLKGLIGELRISEEVVTVYCGLSAICLAKDQVHHDRKKQIDAMYRYLHTDMRVKVKKIVTGDNLTNFFTKHVPFNKFKYCLGLLNIDTYIV